MSAATDYLETKILNDFFVNQPVYIGLYPADPTDKPGVAPAPSEIAGGAYVRKQAQFTVSGSVATLQSDVVWTGMPACTVGGLVIFDAISGGNPLVRSPLTATKQVGAGDAFALPAANVTISVD